MATYEWSQEIETAGQAILYGYTRKVTLRGTQTIDIINKTSKIQVKYIDIYGGSQYGMGFYLDGKILVNGIEVYSVSSSPATTSMTIVANQTVSLAINTSEVEISHDDEGKASFTVQMINNNSNYSGFYWVNGNYVNYQWYTVKTVYTVTANPILKVSYNSNDGSGAMSPTYVAYGSSYEVLENDFTAPVGTSTTHTITLNSNYSGGVNNTKTVTNILPKIFDVWRQDNESGTQRAPGEVITVTDNVVLYATWKDDTLQKETIILGAISRNNTTSTGYVVSFDTQGGSEVNSQTSTRTTKYTHQGWMSSSTGASVEYNTTSSYSFTADTTLYAKWSSTISNNSITLPSAPSKTGYEFLGWGTSANATTYKQAGEAVTPSANTTYYAIWEAAGCVRIYINDTDKYKPALVYIYKPDNDQDTRPWKLVIPYIKTSTDWKVVAG